MASLVMLSAATTPLAKPAALRVRAHAALPAPAAHPRRVTTLSQRHQLACGHGLGNPGSVSLRRPSLRTRAASVEVEAESAAPTEPEAADETATNGNGNAPSGRKKKGKKGEDMTGASSVTSGVRVEGLKKTFKNVDVLKDVSWECKEGERVGLVGNNGAGKTTQLQIITGALEADAGTVLLPRRAKVAYLTQEFEVVESRTVREEFMTVFGEQVQIQKDLELWEGKLANCGDDMELMQEAIEQLTKLQNKADTMENAAEMDKFIDQMMGSLGFTEEDNDRLVASYSGGWKMRMSLGKILLQEPDLLLLDEPTNHLDLDTVEWLENYLKQQTVPMVIVSHDRAFLDQLCTKIVETERGVAKTWRGNYSKYLAQKETEVTAQMAAWERQQKELQRQTEMINRLSGGGQAGRAEAAKKAMEKMRSEGLMVEKPFIHKKRSFTFPSVGRSGRIVAECEGLTHSYGAKNLFNDANLLVEAGERVAFVGPNGCGKSTFLRFLLDQERPDTGRVHLGTHKVIPNFFSQNQAEALDPERSIIETLEMSGTDKPLSELKALLGRFMFQGDRIHTKVGFLSGGEKARVALALFLVTPATLLVLDEPTNHLDIMSKEMLEEAVKAFEGTVLAVSHDRYFLRQIATRVVDVKDGKFCAYEGDYQYFLESNEDAAEKEEKFAEKEAEVAKDNVKAKSKMSKAEKAKAKKEKAKQFGQAKKGSKKKNAQRWN